MKLFKFLTKVGQVVTIEDRDPETGKLLRTLEYSGCLVGVLAEDEADARARVRTFAVEHGVDMRWVDHVPAVERSLDIPGVACIVI